CLTTCSGPASYCCAGGERPALCDAGLFHSVYGTEHFSPSAVPLGMREEVAGLIGAEGENLAWLLGVLGRQGCDESVGRADGLRVRDRLSGEWLPLTHGQFSDLVPLTFANTMEALPRLSWLTRRACRAYLARLRGSGPPAAERGIGEAG